MCPTDATLGHRVATVVENGATTKGGMHRESGNRSGAHSGQGTLRDVAHTAHRPARTHEITAIERGELDDTVLNDSDIGFPCLELSGGPETGLIPLVVGCVAGIDTGRINRETGEIVLCGRITGRARHGGIVPAGSGSHSARLRRVSAIAMECGVAAKGVVKLLPLGSRRHVPPIRANASHAARTGRAARVTVHHRRPVVQIAIILHQRGIVVGNMTARRHIAVRGTQRDRRAIRIMGSADVLTSPALGAHSNRLIDIAVKIAHG